ncbi:MAG TPA: hypothetical protein VL742_12295 [Casimicrobiaceae bacterium]|nr:hypothetical protein [Casimicrobiaceae bacterium]
MRGGGCPVCPLRCARAGAAAKAAISGKGRACIGGHEKQSPAFVEQWKTSKHAAKGLDCYARHRGPSDAEGMDHYGYRVAVLVTAKDCGQWHATDVQETSAG